MTVLGSSILNYPGRLTRQYILFLGNIILMVHIGNWQPISPHVTIKITRTYLRTVWPCRYQQIYSHNAVPLRTPHQLPSKIYPLSRRPENFHIHIPKPICYPQLYVHVHLDQPQPRNDLTLSIKSSSHYGPNQIYPLCTLVCTHKVWPIHSLLIRFHPRTTYID